MTASADVVIIGGGVIGASVAYHLAARGCTGVRVLEREAAPGLGSTGKATGGFRCQFGSEVNVRLSLLAREKLLRFADETGVDSGYRPCGYLFLADEPATLDALVAAQAVQHAAGACDPRAVTAEEAREINPAISIDGIAGGTWCTCDGFIRPLEMLRGYTEAARRLGVRFDHGVEVAGFGMDGDRITTVRTSGGGVAAGAVVNAAGAWAGAVARMAGVEIPVTPLRRQVAATVATEVLPDTMPLTIFVDDGFHARVRDGRVLLLWPDEARMAEPYDAAFDEVWLPEVTRRAHRRFPALREVPVDRAACWAGLYEMSPDKHVLLGRAPGVDNLFLANGSSGHGVMHSPALGHLLAEIILDGAASTLDVRSLRPSRFAEGEPVSSPEFL
ncbi:FAD-binding oxidoreductase [Longimicrobium sp.]|uniref:NAD(P)/FAD-dependent oxidoreductase n=1 Tax=Longimicrobium sp. TaxID=2029185 RepID=UPI002B86BDB8|nr:FAD-binding oxidoreductase [Longimicrobium sp.]HSU13618.1 FAD-binding oxidoreductase [Longimicrobium sp.]